MRELLGRQYEKGRRWLQPGAQRKQHIPTCGQTTEVLVLPDDSGSMHELKAKQYPDISQTDVSG